MEVGAGADQMFCLRMRRHLLEGHVRANSNSLYRLPYYVSPRQVAHQVHEVSSLLHNAAAALLCVPPLWLGNVVVGAGIPSHNGGWSYANLQWCHVVPVIPMYYDDDADDDDCY